MATYGFNTILQLLLEDMCKLSTAGGYPIRLKSGDVIHLSAALVAYVADNPAAHQSIGLKESVGVHFESSGSAMQTMMSCKMDSVKRTLIRRT